eukprot:6192090-Pleurochrysis_carterae.AAC.1
MAASRTASVVHLLARARLVEAALQMVAPALSTLLPCATREMQTDHVPVVGAAASDGAAQRRVLEVAPALAHHARGMRRRVDCGVALRRGRSPTIVAQLLGEAEVRLLRGGVGLLGAAHRERRAKRCGC